MTNSQISTKSYLPNEIEMKAMELKYSGKTYEEIKNLVGVSVDTSKEWFRVGGKLRETYDTYLVDQNNMRREEARRIIRQNLNNAAKILAKSLLSSDEKIALKASIEMLNRELGQPVQPVEVDSTVALLIASIGLKREKEENG